MTAPLRLDLVVCDYRVGAVFDHYDDGGSEIFDVAEAEIVAGDRSGRRLRVLVPSETAEAKAWNRPGARFEVGIDAALLDGGSTLFAGAFDPGPEA
ncbi:MAG TPA: hypothetical protein VEA61_12570 [Allosphingosinicella sp.]|nr:hypothetical protein [Allosphingosinicella sp.]